MDCWWGEQSSFRPSEVPSKPGCWPCVDCAAAETEEGSGFGHHHCVEDARLPHTNKSLVIRDLNVLNKGWRCFKPAGALISKGNKWTNWAPRIKRGRVGKSSNLGTFMLCSSAKSLGNCGSEAESGHNPSTTCTWRTPTTVSRFTEKVECIDWLSPWTVVTARGSAPPSAKLKACGTCPQMKLVLLWLSKETKAKNFRIYPIGANQRTKFCLK